MPYLNTTRGGGSCLSAAFSFILTCIWLLAVNSRAQAQTYILNEDFSSATGTTPPSGWSNTANPATSSDRWVFENPSHRAVNFPISGKFAMFDSERLSAGGGAENVVLETRFFDASVGVNTVLYFDHVFAGGSLARGTVEAYNGSSWVIVKTYTDSTANPESEVVDLSAVTGGVANAKVRFRWTGNGARYWAIDNLSIFSPVTLDGGVTGVATPLMPFSAGQQAVRVRLTDFGRTSITQAQLGWSMNGVQQAPVSWSGNLNLGASQDLLLGNYTFPRGTPIKLKAWLMSVNGQLDASRYNDTLKTTLTSSLCGQYTIGGTNPDFVDFAAAATSLNIAGISCPVVFKVRTGTYSNRFMLNEIIGSSARNTITFESELGDSAATILYDLGSSESTQDYNVKLDGTDYITFKRLSFKRASGSEFNIVGVNGNKGITITGCMLSTLNAYGTVLGIERLDSGLTLSKCRIAGMVYAFGNGTGQPTLGVRIESDSFSTGGGLIRNGIPYYNALYITKTERMVVQNNRIATTQGQAGGVQLDSAGNVTVMNNRITNRGRGGYTLVVTGYGACRIERNVVYMFSSTNFQARGVLTSLIGTGTMTVRRNLITGSSALTSASGLSAFSQQTAPSLVQIDSNTIKYADNGLNVSCMNAVISNNTLANGRIVGISLVSPYQSNGQERTVVSGNLVTGYTTGMGLNVGVSSALVYNNFIQAGGSSTAGLQVAGSNNKIFFNTVNATGIDAASSALLYVSGRSNVLKNNIFAHTGAGYAIRLASAQADTGLVMDYNDYYSAAGKLTLVGQLPIPYLTDYQAAVGQDAHSLSLSPRFADPTQPYPEQSALGGAGTPTTGITLDITGLIRPNPPTIGAQENAGCAPDAGLMGFVNLRSPMAAGVRPIQVVLHNSSANNVRLTTATIHWSVNNVVQPTYSFAGSLGQGQSQTVNLGSYTFQPGIFYTVQAWVAMPNGQADCNTSNDSLTRGPIMPALCGTYTIGGTNPSFPTFTAALQALDQAGIACHVVFKVRNGTYSEILRMLPLQGMTDTSSVTFEAETGDSSTVQVKMVSTNASSYLVDIAGISNLVFRGIGFPPSSYVNTVQLSAQPTNIRFDHCLIDKLKTTEGYNRLTVQNSMVNSFSLVATDASRSNGLILVGDSLTGPFSVQYTDQVQLTSCRFRNTLTSRVTPLFNNCNQVVVSGCRISAMSYGSFSFKGCKNVQMKQNTVILRSNFRPDGIALQGCTGNTILWKNQFVAASGLYFTQGINLYQTTVDNNASQNLNHVILDSNVIAQSPTGITMMLGVNDSVRIERNLIQGTSVDGIRVQNFGSSSTLYCRSVLLYRNRITGMVAGKGINLLTGGVSLVNNYVQGSSGASSAFVGISFDPQYGSTTVPWQRIGSHIYFNSVNMYGTDPDLVRAFQYTSGRNLDIRNNIFSNTGPGYAAYLNANVADSASTLDYNDYYSGAAMHAYISGTTYASLTSIQTATGQNAHSFVVNPSFSSGGPQIGEPSLGQAGIHVDTVAYDINGDARPGRPTLGAQEREGCLLDATLTGFVSVHNPLQLGSRIVDVSLRSQAGTQIDSARIGWSVNDVVQPAIGWTGRLGQDQSDTVSLGRYTFLPGVTYRISAWIVRVNGQQDCSPFNDTARLGELNAPLCGIYTIGGSNPSFATFGAAVKILNTSGVSCPVTFRVRSGLYREQVQLSRIPGASAQAPVTFESEAGDSVLCRIQTTVGQTGTTLVLSGTRHVTFSGIGIIQSGSQGGLRAESSCKNLRFWRCRLENATVTGLDSGLSIEQCHIAGNIQIAGQSALAAKGVRLLNDTSANCNIKMQYLDGPSVTDGRTYGSTVLPNFSFDHCTNVQVTNTRCSIASTGISLDYVDGFACTNSKLAPPRNSVYQTMRGIWVTHSNDLLIFKSQIGVQNPAMGAALTIADGAGTGHIIIDSNLIQNVASGMLVQPHAEDTVYIRGNTISRVNSYGIQVNPTLPWMRSEHLISGNRISNVTRLQGSGYVAGIDATSQGIRIVNNFVHATGSGDVTGISVSSQSTVLFNAVSLYGSDPIASAAFRVTGGVNHIVKNNIFYHGNNGFAVTLSSAPSGVFTDWDYNDYYSEGGKLGVVGTTAYNTLPLWQNSLHVDPNGQSVNPLYETVARLLPQQRALNGAGTPAGNVRLDIDGELRNGSAPDVGADEFMVDFGITRLLNPTLRCNLGPNDSVTVNVTQFGDVPLQDLRIAYQVNGGPVYIDTIIGSLSNDIAHTFRQRQNLTGPGTYNFKIWLVGISDDNKNNDTLEVERYKGPSPNVNFTYAAGCANAPATFIGSASIVSGSISRYEWLFGDGDTAGTLNPIHQYDSSNTYQVIMRAYSDLGCFGQTSQAVTLTPTPHADFQANDGCQYKTLRFTNRSSLSAGSMTYFWRFGNGDTSTAANPKYVFNQPGIYTVWLRAQAASGCVDSVSQVIVVHPKPVVTITPADTAALLPGGSVTLTATPGFVTYIWPGNQNFQQLVVTTAGAYSVIAIDSNLCSDTSAPVQVVQVPPITISLGHDTTLCVGRSLTLGVDTTYDSYEWTTGDTTETLTVTQPGSYGLTVTGHLGQQAYSEVYVDFAPIPTHIAALAAEYCVDAMPISLQASPSGGTFLGLGVNQGQFVPALAGAGLHRIVYIFQDTAGCQGIDSTDIQVRSVAQPTVSLSGRLSFCEGDSVVLTSSATIGNRWTTGDTTQRLVVRATGTYRVQVLEASCLSPASDSVPVLVSPVPAQPVVLTVTGSDSLFSSVTGNQYEWLLDGQPLVHTGPGIDPRVDGYYQVRVTSAEGCSSVWSDSLYVHVTATRTQLRQSIQLVPNPARGSVQVWGLYGQGAKVWIMDALGKEAKVVTLTPQATVIDIGDLPAGTYTVRVQVASVTTSTLLTVSP